VCEAAQVPSVVHPIAAAPVDLVEQVSIYQTGGLKRKLTKMIQTTRKPRLQGHHPAADRYTRQHSICQPELHAGCC